ncbi:12793_t:CDS:1 [Acaulospora morrowiae]|uniref:12793_t:CDS:1 n=1 Tax=Acaulospora morrowiae TaxID=94023 RepID=A0A9N9GER5_9GLOM|nr:12793_t:CDS:1 [Acaulospora morrowiae]
MSVTPYPPPHRNPTMMQTPHAYDATLSSKTSSPPSATKYTYIRGENGAITVFHQPTKALVYYMFTPSLNSPNVSIIDKHTSGVIWNAKVSSAADISGGDGTKIKPTANWECKYTGENKESPIYSHKTIIKFEKSLKGYVCSWNGRVFLWKLYGSGGDIYCVEGLSGIGERVAQFEDKSNTLMIDLSRYSVGKYKSDNGVESLKSFESFILLTGLIAKNSAKKLQSTVNRMSANFTDAHLFNYSGLFFFCGLCGTF